MKALRPLLLLAALACLLAGESAPALGADHDQWVPSGQLVTPREHHVAVRLASGMVLAAGGAVENQSYQETALASAELYDPATRTWTATDSMATPRIQPVGVLLPDGDVLVAGGDGAQPLASAERYHPADGTWSPAGTMSAGRSQAPATLLPGGKVLVAGGYTAPGAPTASADLYDPATNTWTPTGVMTTARASHTATLLPNGMVLVAGGDGGNHSTPSAELYDPATGVWTATGSMAIERREHSATLLNSGEVLVAGGFPRTTSTELYDPATGLWTAGPNMANERYGHSAILVPDGRVLVVLGAPKAESFDPAAGHWSPEVAISNFKGTATLLADGTVLVAGGVLETGVSVDMIDTSALWPAPFTTITSSPPDQTMSRSAAFTFTASDPNATFECQLDAGAFMACPSPQQYSNVPDGTHAVSVRAKSQAGLTDPTPVSATWTVDNSPPTVTITSPAAGRIGDRTPILSGNGATVATDVLRVYLTIYRGSGTTGAVEQTFSVQAYHGWTVETPEGLADGPHTVVVEEHDKAGNLGRSTPLTFTVDTEPPAVTLASPAKNAVIATGIPTFSGAAGTAPGDLPGVTVRLYGGKDVTGAPLQTLHATAAAGAWSVKGDFALTEGMYTAQAEQADDLGYARTTAPTTFQVKSPPPAGQPPAPVEQPGGGGQPPVSPPLVVSNVISFGRTTVARDGTITLRLVAPGPGTFAVRGTVRVGGTVKYGSGAAVAVGAGTVKVRVRPGKAGRRALKRGRKLRVRLAITFNPLGGTPATVTKTVTVRPAKRRSRPA